MSTNEVGVKSPSTSLRRPPSAARNPDNAERPWCAETPETSPLAPRTSLLDGVYYRHTVLHKGTARSSGGEDTPREKLFVSG
mmetsp:Transcript_20820/g.46213  ORF Transcript_20820/g.46213 Transcript_20820/m.46213 type:complete len:82 (-) Transcript_20820:321-566(-)